MKVRATTSFSVNPSTSLITYDDVRVMVETALARLTSEHDLVEEASITSGGFDDGRDLVVELDIVLLSESYGEVDEAMLQLVRYIESTMEDGPTSSRRVSRETQLVPA